ncbi:MAG: hypothetical protein CMJ84_08695 [Planctomycetes bacterium]|jgi:hypothetical protein|nr:hypothetical protein [Planctomycetota bacterium]
MPRRLLLSSLVAVLTLLGAEGAHRLWSAARPPGAYDATDTRTAMQELLNSVNQTIPMPGDVKAASFSDSSKRFEILHPFLGFDANYGPEQLLNDIGNIRHDPDAYWILILGGSVANIFGQQGTERLGELLAADPRFAGRSVRFLNYGRASFKQPQQVMMATWLFSFGIQPDAVINLDGFNEVAVSNANVAREMHPVYPAYGQWLAQVRSGDADMTSLEMLTESRRRRSELIDFTQRCLDRRLYLSSLAGGWALGRMRAERKALVAGTMDYLEHLKAGGLDPWLLGPTFAPDRDQGLQFSVANWQRSSISLAGLCAGHGVLYLHALQPTLYDEGSKPLTDQELEVSKTIVEWVEGARLGYPLLREAGETLREHGIGFVDCSMVFEDVVRPLYYDACHFTRGGNVRLAEAIAPAFLAHLP